MKIVNIFAEKLFAFHYKEEAENEYDRLMDLWNNPVYLRAFLKDNIYDLPVNKTINQIADAIIEDSYAIDDSLIAFTNNPRQTLSQFFRPLHDREYPIKVLSLQKGRKSYLRIYAIRIDEDTYVVTGGAIKLTRTMQEKKHTMHELQKLEKAKRYLASQEIIDDGSFFEFLEEN